jgi:hypothetical protein
MMSHRGCPNGRLSMLLSCIQENYPVIVSADSIADHDVADDQKVCEHHGARFVHCTPWGGRARNAIHCMQVAPWRIVFYLCDDVYLFPETCHEALRWWHTFEVHGLPMASMGCPGWETYHDHKQLGFECWNECLLKPWKFENSRANPGFAICPKLHKNPFGACMVVNKTAYTELGGFSEWYWAHDDVWNHKVWFSDKWLSTCYPGRGYAHLGAQSGHFGETAEYVGTFERATGMKPEDSGRIQYERMAVWSLKFGDVFNSLGGEP